MVISGVTPLIVYAFRRVRRSTSIDAFQTYDAGRARMHLPSEAVNRTRPSDVLTRIKPERVPTCTGARNNAPTVHRYRLEGSNSDRQNIGLVRCTPEIAVTVSAAGRLK